MGDVPEPVGGSDRGAPSSLFGVLPLADFGTAKFTKVKVDGAAIGTASPTEITMVDSGGTAEDAISAPTNDKAFSATWQSST